MADKRVRSGGRDPHGGSEFVGEQPLGGWRPATLPVQTARIVKMSADMKIKSLRGVEATRHNPASPRPRQCA